MSIEKDAYDKHKNLKLAAAELGIAWQKLYCKLKAEGVKVVGDKLRYGTDRDKLGALGEALFKQLVPHAIDKNEEQFQSKYDFDVKGYKVDIKAGRPKQMNKRFSALSWSFSFKKQRLIADFIVCFCLSKNKDVEHILLVPSEFFKGLQTISMSCDGNSKWKDYAISEQELTEFFNNINEKKHDQ